MTTRAYAGPPESSWWYRDYWLEVLPSYVTTEDGVSRRWVWTARLRPDGEIVAKAHRLAWRDQKDAITDAEEAVDQLIEQLFKNPCTPFARNPSRDEQRKRLSRADDPGLLGRIIHESFRTRYFTQAVEAIIQAGWEQAVRVIALLELGSPRDDLVLELGRELVRRGWAPDLPLGSELYRAGAKTQPGTEISRQLPWESIRRAGREVRIKRQFGKVGSWRFFPVSEFHGFHQGGIGNIAHNQGWCFLFYISTAGKHHRAQEFARAASRGETDALKTIAPLTWFLYRWTDSEATTMPNGLGGTGLWAGLPSQSPANIIWAHERSRGHHSYPDTNNINWRESFLRQSRAFLPGETPPPQDAASSEVRAWVMNPERLENVRALFYGDLFLGGMLLPPELVFYDPETLGPSLNRPSQPPTQPLTQPNPATDDKRYRFVHSCIHSTYEDIQDLYKTSQSIERETFIRKLAPGEWSSIQQELGYDRSFPIKKDWHVSYHRGMYRGVRAVYLVWSRIEYIFTLDGKLGKSLVSENPDPRRRKRERDFSMQTGDVAAKAAVITEQLRAGLLDPELVAIAGYLGDEAAAMVVPPWKPDPSHYYPSHDPKGRLAKTDEEIQRAKSGEGLVRIEQETRVRLYNACLLAILPPKRDNFDRLPLAAKILAGALTHARNAIDLRDEVETLITKTIEWLEKYARGEITPEHHVLRDELRDLMGAVRYRVAFSRNRDMLFAASSALRVFRPMAEQGSFFTESLFALSWVLRDDSLVMLWQTQNVIQALLTPAHHTPRNNPIDECLTCGATLIHGWCQECAQAYREPFGPGGAQASVRRKTTRKTKARRKQHHKRRRRR